MELRIALQALFRYEIKCNNIHFCTNLVKVFKLLQNSFNQPIKTQHLNFINAFLMSQAGFGMIFTKNPAKTT